MKLLICIPLKTAPHYQERKKLCLDTWLKDCPCDYKFFTDADLGLDENDPLIRPKRTKGMVKYAYYNGYDFCFRVDADSWVWVQRLLSSGYEQHDYTGYCNDYPQSRAIHRTAHGGSGFILSRRAMKIIIDAPITRCLDGKYWGDIWTGEVLYRHRIYCHRDTRFYPDASMWQHKDDLSNAISIHPIIEN